MFLPVKEHIWGGNPGILESTEPQKSRKRLSIQKVDRILFPARIIRQFSSY